MGGVLTRFQFQWCWVSTVLLYLLVRKRISTSTVQAKPDPIGGIVFSEFFFLKEIPDIAIIVISFLCFTISNINTPVKWVICHWRCNNFTPEIPFTFYRLAKSVFQPGTVSSYSIVLSNKRSIGGLSNDKVFYILIRIHLGFENCLVNL